MPLTLHVDGPRWRAHLERIRDGHPGLVPVIKGNGYGFGIDRLAERSAWLGVDTVAVGTYTEARTVAEVFPGSLLVLTPWRPFEAATGLDPRLVHTLGRLEDLRALTARAAEAGAEPPRVVLERLTSMRRHGFSARDLRLAAREAAAGGRVRVEGVALHLPMVSTTSTHRPKGPHLAEVHRLMTDIVASGVPARRVFVSHLTEAELGALGQAYPDYELRPRIGTLLWLGDRAALRVTATVLDVHPVERGDVYGYRSRTAPAAGSILVVSGGTAHGIGLEAPTAGTTLRDRAERVADGEGGHEEASES